MLDGEEILYGKESRGLLVTTNRVSLRQWTWHGRREQSIKLEDITACERKGLSDSEDIATAMELLTWFCGSPIIFFLYHLGFKTSAVIVCASVSIAGALLHEYLEYPDTLTIVSPQSSIQFRIPPRLRSKIPAIMENLKGAMEERRERSAATSAQASLNQMVQ